MSKIYTRLCPDTAELQAAMGPYVAAGSSSTA